MEHQGKTETPHPPHDPFETAVMVGVTVREDDRPQVGCRRLQDVEVVEQRVTPETGVVKQRRGGTGPMGSDEQGITVFCPQMLNVVADQCRWERPATGGSVGGGQDVDGVVDDHRDLDPVDRLQCDLCHLVAHSANEARSLKVKSGRASDPAVAPVPGLSWRRLIHTEFQPRAWAGP